MTETTTSSPSSPAQGPIREHVPTVIVGAGQAGLATAYFLGRAGHRCVVLHQDARVGDVWRRRYDSLRLNTPARYDRLPGIDWTVGPWDAPTRDQMADLLEAYAAKHDMDVRHRTRVRRIEKLGESFVVTTDRGVLEADSVVVATGGEQHPRVPDVARALDPGIRQVHSHDYRNPAQLLPGPVLVVGCGQSGADIALELARAGHEVWLSGRPSGEVPVDIDARRARIALRVLFFVWNHVLTERTPLGRRAKQKVRHGGAPLVRVKLADLADAGVHHREARTTGTRDGRPELADGTVLDVTNVVWCTGFRQDFSFIHPSVVGEDGWPRDEGGVVPELPGLFFMGLLFQRGFYSMLIGGAGRDAEHIAGQVLRRARVADPH